MSGIKSGYGTKTLPFWAVFNLYVIFICTSIPGLAISPIMGKLTEIFPGTTPLETQFLEIGPNIMAIPFVFLGGWIGTKFNNNKLTTWTCLLYGICGVLFFFAPNMITLIILSFLIGIFAGIISPLSSAFIADMFGGEKRTAQYGYTSATLNLVLVFCTIATGYLAKVDWRLPFAIYLLPIVPLFFAKKFGQYITNPQQIRDNDAKQANAPKVHYKFSKEVNMGMLIRYCIYYFVITFVIAAISLYLPFRYKDPSTAGDLTSLLYFGIMASGYTLNWCVRVLRGKVAIWGMLAIVIGFILITITSDVIIVGVGILLATYFYGIAQPYYYDRLSAASSRIALTLTLAWFAVMDSLANVVAAPLIDLTAKIFHRSTTTDPNLAFVICTVLVIVSLVVIIIRKIGVTAREHHKINEDGQPNVASVQPIAHGATATAVAAAPATAAVSSAPAQKVDAQAAPAKDAAPSAPAQDSAPSAPDKPAADDSKDPTK